MRKPRKDTIYSYAVKHTYDDAEFIQKDRIKYHIGTFCPNCFESNIFEYDYKLKIIAEDPTAIRPAMIDEPRVVLHCNNCGKDFLITSIDPNIVWAVAELNRKGYTTTYSCEGHIEKNKKRNKYNELEPYTDASQPYIMFKDEERIRNTIRENPPIGSWKLDFSDIIRISVDFPEAETNEEIFKILSDPSKKAEWIGELNDWVESLPSINISIVVKTP